MSEKTYCTTVTIVVLVLCIIALSLLPAQTPEKENTNCVPEPEETILVVKPDYSYNYCTEIQEPEKIYYDVPLDNDTQDYLFSVCESYGVEPALIIAMIDTESGFSTNSISKTGDFGLMQINKCNHARLKNLLGITDFLDAKQNILCGVAMISSNLVENDYDYVKALMCYNMGTNGAKTAWRRGITGTAYTDKVMANLSKYR